MTARTRSGGQGTLFFLVVVGSLTDFDLHGFFGSSPSSTAMPRMLERMSKMPSIVDTSKPPSCSRRPSVDGGLQWGCSTFPAGARRRQVPKGWGWRKREKLRGRHANLRCSSRCVAL